MYVSNECARGLLDVHVHCIIQYMHVLIGYRGSFHPSTRSGAVFCSAPTACGGQRTLRRYTGEGMRTRNQCCIVVRLKVVNYFS